MLEKLIRLMTTWQKFGNPVEIWYQRLFGMNKTSFRVVDRGSRIACICRPEAHRMFGEVWFDRDYDVPGLVLRPGDTVLDIGGNQGFFACYAAWQGCRVISFEPDPGNIRLLEQNLQANGLASKVKVIPAAVKAHAGEVRLFRTDQMGGGMNTTMPHFAEQLGFAEGDSQIVPAVSLPEVLKAEGVDRVRLCKMDCEGAELEIVSSLTKDDMGRIDAFALEFHREAYSPMDLVKALERWGTHHVFPAASKSYCQRDILYAISKRAMDEILCPVG